MDETEIVRLGKEAGYTEKSLRTAREKLGVKPTKQGFGPKGKWMWPPPGGAPVLTLVVNNDANRQIPPDDEQRAGSSGGSGENQAADSQHAQDAGTAEPGKPEGGSDNPDGGNAA